MLDESWLFSCSSQDPGYLQDVHYVAFLLSPRARVKSLRHRRENPQTADGLPLANVAKLFRQHKQKMLPYIDKFYASNPYARSCAAIEWKEFRTNTGRFAGQCFQVGHLSMTEWWQTCTKSTFLAKMASHLGSIQVSNQSAEHG